MSVQTLQRLSSQTHTCNTFLHPATPRRPTRPRTCHVMIQRNPVGKKSCVGNYYQRRSFHLIELTVWLMWRADEPNYQPPTEYMIKCVCVCVCVVYCQCQCFLCIFLLVDTHTAYFVFQCVYGWKIWPLFLEKRWGGWWQQQGHSVWLVQLSPTVLATAALHFTAFSHVYFCLVLCCKTRSMKLQHIASSLLFPVCWLAERNHMVPEQF